MSPVLTGVQDVSPGLTMPTQHIYLQLADPFTTADYTDITPLVKQWSGTVRGRQHELQLFQPGQVALTLESNLNGGRFNPWNTQSPYYNLLSPDDAAQIASNGTWAFTTNCVLGTFPQTPPVALDVGYALLMESTTSGTMSINTSETAYAVTAGNQYSAMASFLANGPGRSCTVGIQWYNAANSLISTSTSATVSDAGVANTMTVVQAVGSSSATASGSAATFTTQTTKYGNGLIAIVIPVTTAADYASSISGCGGNWIGIGTGENITMWYTTSNTGGTAITAHMNSGGNYYVFVIEVTNLGGYLSGSAVGAGTTSAGPATLTLDPTSAGYLCVAAAQATATTFSAAPGSPWTAPQSGEFVNANGDGVAYQIAATAGNTTASWTMAASAAWQTAGMVFYPKNSSSSTWTKASLLGATAPAGAVTAAVITSVSGLPGANEWHWVNRAALFNYTGNVPNTAWAPGQRGLVPGRPMYCTATWGGVTYPIWSMYISNFTPSYGQTKSEQVINCADGLALLSLGDLSTSSFGSQVLSDGALSFWRLGDAPGSVQAADSGPLNNPLNATNITFGETSPIATDDTTVALLSQGSAYGYLTDTFAPNLSIGSLEFYVNIPPLTNANTYGLSGNPQGILLFSQNGGGTDINAEIYYNTSGQLLVVGGGSSVGAGSMEASVPQLANGQWHQIVVTWSGALNGTMTLYVDGAQVATVSSPGVGYGTTMLSGGSFTFGTYAFTTLLYTYSGVTISAPVQYNYPGQMADIAYYNTTLTAAQILNHYNMFTAGYQVQYSGTRIQTILTAIGWPSSLQNIATGISQVQAATTLLTQTSALSYMQSIESTEMGALFVDPSGNLTFLDRHYIITATAATVSNGTFSNRPSDIASGAFAYLAGLVPALDDTDLWNDVPGQRNGGVLQRTQNTTSIKYYLRRTLTGYTGQLQTTDAEVLAQTQWLCQMYSTPYTRCRSLTLSSVTDSGRNLQQMLGRAIFDRITLVWNPIDGSSVYFNQPSLIESIQHTVTQQQWITTWGLSPAETQQHWMVLNDPTRGQLSTNNQLAY